MFRMALPAWLQLCMSVGQGLMLNKRVGQDVAWADRKACKAHQ